MASHALRTPTSPTVPRCRRGDLEWFSSGVASHLVTRRGRGGAPLTSCDVLRRARRSCEGGNPYVGFITMRKRDPIGERVATAPQIFQECDSRWYAASSQVPARPAWR